MAFGYRYKLERQENGGNLSDAMPVSPDMGDMANPAPPSRAL
jgi:hypothetical protein